MPYLIPKYRVSLVRDSSVRSDNKKISNSATATEILRPLFAGADREMFYVLALDSKNSVIGANLVSIGSLSASIVHPREVFKFAILSSAAAIVLAHNHPSGSGAPSHEDYACTDRLVSAGKLLGITVLDHIILGDTEHFSFADSGLLNRS